MTRIALVGYGSMGKEIERLAPTHACEVVAVYDVDAPLTSSGNNQWDVAIDFTVAEAVPHTVEIIAEMGKGLVIGTTGWNSQFEHVRSVVQQSNIGCVFGSNFSVGMQMFFRLARAAGVLLNAQPEYDVMIHEWHHARKKDSPSGTALTLGTILLDEVERKTGLITETQHGAIDSQLLHVTSTRGGNIAGRHTITIDGEFDRIDLTHDARNRSGFASGALRAARWIHHRKGFYDFTDIFMQLAER